MSDVLIVPSQLSSYLMVPAPAVKADLVTEIGKMIYVPIATANTFGVVKIGDGLSIENGVISANSVDIPVKGIKLNDILQVPDENDIVNLSLTKATVGLNKVDNTADIDKPVSTATTTELNKKLDKQQPLSEAGKYLYITDDGSIGFNVISGGGGSDLVIKSDDTVISEAAQSINFKNLSAVSDEDNNITVTGLIVDAVLDDKSTNAVQNKIITNKINDILLNNVQIAKDYENAFGVEWNAGFLAGNSKATGNWAIGIGADSEAGQLGISIGNRAISNGGGDVIIGTAAKRTDSTGYSSVAVGNGAKVSGIRNVAIGSGAQVNVTTSNNSTVQLGYGINETDGSLQFRQYTVVDTDGKIPNERLFIDNDLSTESNNLLTNAVITSNLNKKLDTAGGNISGNLTIQGNLNVLGTTTTEKQQTLEIVDNIIVTNANKVDLQASLSGLAINKNANDTFLIGYDPATDSVKLGLGTLTNGSFTFAEGEGKAVATRVDSSELVNDHLLIWDSNTNSIKDSTATLADIIDTIAYTSEVFVPKSRTVAGKPLTNNITLDSLTVTYGGSTIIYDGSEAKTLSIPESYSKTETDSKYVKIENPKSKFIFTNDATTPNVLQLLDSSKFVIKNSDNIQLLSVGTSETTLAIGADNKVVNLKLDNTGLFSSYIDSQQAANTTQFTVADDLLGVYVSKNGKHNFLKLTSTDFTLNDNPILIAGAQTFTSEQQAQIRTNIGITSSGISYNELTDKPALNTVNSLSLAVSENEAINGIINLHKISKTGKFSDLNDIPSASETVAGIIQIASDTEAETGTNTLKAVNPKQLKTAIDGLGSVFTLKGSVQSITNLPTTGNVYGDVYYVIDESVGYVWLNDGTTDRWEQLGLPIDLSTYVQFTDVVNNLTSELTDKPLSAYQGKVLNESILNVRQSIPTNTSQLTNDSGYITGYTEIDPTVPDWAKQSTKPTYTYSEITEKPTLATVATSGSYDDLTNKPDIPSEVTVDSALSTTSENAVQNKAISQQFTQHSILLNDLANQKVGKETDETISGTKTFSSDIWGVDNNGIKAALRLINGWAALRLFDENDLTTAIAHLVLSKETDGTSSAKLLADKIHFYGNILLGNENTPIEEAFLKPPNHLFTKGLTKNSTFTPEVNGYIIARATANDKNGAYFRIHIGSVDGGIICGTLGATGKSLGYNSAPSMICPVTKGVTYYIEASASYYSIHFTQAS